jgi:parvulin-like peptidyl-prolyl isomerase
MKPPLSPKALLSLAALALLSTGEIIERVVVKVNGDIVTLSDFESRQLAAIQQARIAPDQVEEYLRRNNAKILQDAEDELLLVQKAAELEIKVRPEYLKEVLDGIKKENHLDSDQALDAQLQKEGLTLADLKRNISHQILRRQVVSREVESKITVSEADARADYDAHIDTYRKKATIKLEEIVLKKKDDALAQELVEKARGGADFEGLAKAHSTAKTKDSGGLLGTVSRGELNPELEKVAFALPPGGVSDPVATGDTVRILKVVETTPEKITPFESVREEITRRLTDEKMGAEYTAFIEKLRKGAMMEVKVREVPTEILQGGPVLNTGVPAPSASPTPQPSPSAAAGDTDEFSTLGNAAPEHHAPGKEPSPPPPSPSPHP